MTPDLATLSPNYPTTPTGELPSWCCVTLNSHRAASLLVRIWESEERWEASDHPQGVLPQNWGETELNLSVTYEKRDPDFERMSPRARFRAGVFLQIIDNLEVQLNKRRDCYEVLNTRFEIFRNLHEKDVVPIRISSQSSHHCWRSPLPHASPLIQRDFGCVLRVQQSKQPPHVAKVDQV
ncbi:hypothetical protein TNCV_974341 [Trichonephila clavipes]|nr:hypothetical protein TNCV_974341 [Trichonephila clavipes]